jgi:hypothetical protein
MSNKAKVGDQLMVFTETNNFYLIDTVPDLSLKMQAEDNGTLNDFIVRIETPEGEVLYERPPQTIH